MNKKNKKRIIISSILSGLMVTGVVSPLVYFGTKKTSVNNIYVNNEFESYNAQNEANIKDNPLGNQYYYVFENKRFYTLDDIAEYYIEKYESLSSDYYIGDLNNSITDYDSKIIDILKMRKYDKKRISPAYKNAIGQYDYNYDVVKQSYINPGLVKYKYDDFNGNIFNTYDEAKKSILNTTSSNPILYYELENGYKFNPLNKNDLNLFKNDIFRKLNIKYKNPLNINSTINDFDIKIYDKNSNSYTSNGSELFFQKNLIKTMTEKMIFDYYNTKFEVLNDYRTKFEVNLNIRDYGYKGLTDYVFQETNGGNAIVQPGAKTLKFNNVSYKDLGKFAAFTNRDLFFENANSHTNSELPSFTLGVQKHIWNRMARKLEVTNLLGTNFKIKYIGKDPGGDKGVDIDIMQEGTEKPACFMAFDVEFINKNENFNQTIMQKFENKRAEFEKKHGAHSLLTKINNFIYNKVLKAVSSPNNNAPKRMNMESFINVRHVPPQYQNRYDYKHERAKNFTFETTRLIPNSIDHILKNNFMIDNSELCTFIDHKTNTIKHENILDDTQTLINYINGGDYQYIIEYNGKPLFQVDNILSTLNENNIFQFSFVNNISNYFNSELTKTKLEGWKNVSQNFTMQKTKDGQYYSIQKDSDNFIKSKQDYEWEFIQKGSNSIYPEAPIPSLNNTSGLDSYKINSIISVFNQSLKKIKKGSNWEMILNKQFNKANDVLFLYDRNQNMLSPKQLSYREYLDNGFNRSISIYNNNQIKLFDDPVLIEQAIANRSILDPAKVVVLYDLLGNVINPGVRLTEEQKLQTTNDAIYDSENLIIDNLLRTKLIPIDDYKVFYKETTLDEYTLIDKRVNQIYKLNINNKNTYFASFNDALKYLKDYLDLNSIKIGY